VRVTISFAPTTFADQVALPSPLHAHPMTSPKTPLAASLLMMRRNLHSKALARLHYARPKNFPNLRLEAESIVERALSVLEGRTGEQDLQSQLHRVVSTIFDLAGPIVGEMPPAEEEVRKDLLVVAQMLEISQWQSMLSQLLDAIRAQSPELQSALFEILVDGVHFADAAVRHHVEVASLQRCVFNLLGHRKGQN